MDYCKIAGAGLILAASLWAGFHAALRLRQTHETLRELAAALELIAGEISFAAPPFVPLCRRAGEGRTEAVRRFFEVLAREGEKPDFAPEGLTCRACAEAGMLLPSSARLALERLFDGFGRFDREGQLRQIHLASEELAALSGELSGQMEGRCRTYEVLGLTAGAAVLVLVL
ncbi:MAG: stage III sporulation protein AB [Oscillospiraceae bacterium]|nr:stage III sporulation protein AB [Oscillospiraceae bacterium]